MLLPFVLTFAVTIISLTLFVRSVKSEIGTEGEVMLKGSAAGGFWFAVLMVSSFFALESFARLLATWTGFH